MHCLCPFTEVLNIGFCAHVYVSMSVPWHAYCQRTILGAWFSSSNLFSGRGFLSFYCCCIACPRLVGLPSSGQISRLPLPSYCKSAGITEALPPDGFSVCSGNETEVLRKCPPLSCGSPALSQDFFGRTWNRRRWSSGRYLRAGSCSYVYSNPGQSCWRFKMISGAPFSNKQPLCIFVNSSVWLMISWHMFDPKTLSPTGQGTVVCHVCFSQSPAPCLGHY